MFPNVILLGWIQRGRYSGANKAVLEKEEEGHFYWDTLYSATSSKFLIYLLCKEHDRQNPLIYFLFCHVSR